MHRRYIVVEFQSGPEIFGPFTKAHATEVKDRHIAEGNPAVVYHLYRVYS